jgi:hypothetical protein
MRKIFLIGFLVLAASACQENKKAASSKTSTSTAGKGAEVYRYDPAKTNLNEDAFWDSIHKADFDSVQRVKKEYEKEDKPIIKFDQPSYNFGKIKAGEKVTHEYTFRNVGQAPLIVTQAAAACGCTVPEYSKEPVKPGGTGVIKVEFNSAGKSGMQTKNITIYYNNKVEPMVQVVLTGEVEAKK